MGYAEPVKCREPGCEESTKTTRWNSAQAHDAGWFFPRDGNEAGHCPRHVPEWVPAWRERKRLQQERLNQKQGDRQ